MKISFIVGETFSTNILVVYTFLVDGCIGTRIIKKIFLQLVQFS